MKRSIIAILLVIACGDDTPANDAGVTDALSPDARQLNTGERFQAAEEEERRIGCECEVAAGMHATQEACYAANSDSVSTDAQIACVQGVLDGAPASDVAFYGCTTAAYEDFLACVEPLTCDQIRAGEEVTACLGTRESTRARCGDYTPETDAALDACYL